MVAAMFWQWLSGLTKRPHKKHPPQKGNEITSVLPPEILSTTSVGTGIKAHPVDDRRKPSTYVRHLVPGDPQCWLPHTMAQQIVGVELIDNPQHTDKINEVHLGGKFWI